MIINNNNEEIENDAMQAMISKGIIDPEQDGSIKPIHQAPTRGEVALWMARLYAKLMRESLT